jgi:threonine dehydrogenase-like Zn-dependent dehydrogenase
MDALVYVGPQQLVVRDEPAPEPRPGEVVVSVLAAAICGSELNGVRHNDPSRKPPLIMGHEFVGRRSDTGELVAVNPLVACAECDACRRSQSNLCRARELIGVHRSGGFAELVSVPAANCHELPAGCSTLAAVLVEPLANSWHLWDLSLADTSSRVGVIGAGAIGLLAAIVGTHSGARRVTLADISDVRRGTARAAGVEDVVEQLEDEYDVIIDAVGANDTRRSSVSRLRPGGRAVWEGLHDGETPIDGRDIVRREISVVGSFAYTDEEFARAVATITLVSEQWVEGVPLAEGARAFQSLMVSTHPAVRTVLVPA